MTQSRIRVRLVVPGNPDAFRHRCLLAGQDEPDLTLGQLLREHFGLFVEQVDPALLGIRVSRLDIAVLDPVPGAPLYWPDGVLSAAGPAPALADKLPRQPEGAVARSAGPSGDKPGHDHPETLDEAAAVRMCHEYEISKAAAYLDAGLSVLVRCEKLLVEHLALAITLRTSRTARVVEAPNVDVSGGMGAQASRRQLALAALHRAVKNADPNNDVVVVAHLDLLAGGSDTSLNAEARELTDVVYEPVSDASGRRRQECVLLAFVDPSLVIPEVLANRFAVRMAIDILPRTLRTAEGTPVPLGTALVTNQEARVFEGFNAVNLYKHIAGMNAVRLRNAIRFAVHQHQASTNATFANLVEELRTFKAATSTNSFEVPNVPFSMIGGYGDVQHELLEVLDLLNGAGGVPEDLQHELVPRGLIFYGPPGTGKTLFAKAVATAFNATILVVSGPEVTDMYVGESERKVREIFAQARRNAPSVVVFDEFDSIAAKRVGRDDGGGRAGNALVAQLLTEMDGFRAAVPVLIIGTTNRLDIIDPALLRPSRFRPIHIGLPDRAARRAIAKVHAGHFGISISDSVLDRIAISTDRMNGDEIRSIFRDARAALHAAQPRPADARHLGELVGRLGRITQQREASAHSGVTVGVGRSAGNDSAPDRTELVEIVAGIAAGVSEAVD